MHLPFFFPLSSRVEHHQRCTAGRSSLVPRHHTATSPTHSPSSRSSSYPYRSGSKKLPLLLHPETGTSHSLGAGSCGRPIEVSVAASRSYVVESSSTWSDRGPRRLNRIEPNFFHHPRDLKLQWRWNIRRQSSAACGERPLLAFFVDVVSLLSVLLYHGASSPVVQGAPPWSLVPFSSAMRGSSAVRSSHRPCGGTLL